MPDRKDRDYFFTATSQPGFRGKRLLRADKPTEFTFRRLLDSAAIILEPDDTAQLAQQGLVRLSTDAEVIGRDSELKSDNFEMVLQPHQIPTFTGINGITVTEAAENVTVGTVTRQRTRVTIDGAGSATDELAKVTASDTTSGYLQSKIVAGSNIGLTVLNPGANEQYRIDASTQPDELVKVRPTDTTPGELFNKISAGSNITLSVLNPGANEQLEIVSDDELVKVSVGDTTPGELFNKISVGNNLSTSILNPGANEQISLTDDGRIRLSASNNFSFLDTLITAGTNVTVSLVGSAPNQVLEISSTGGGLSDTGWQNITVTSDWTPGTGLNGLPQYRRIGDFLMFRGQVSSNITLSASTLIATLPVAPPSGETRRSFMSQLSVGSDAAPVEYNSFIAVALGASGISAVPLGSIASPTTYILNTIPMMILT